MLSIKDLMFKERSVKKLVDKYVSSYIINEIVFIYFLFQQFITWSVKADCGSYVVTMYMINELT